MEKIEQLKKALNHLENLIKTRFLKRPGQKVQRISSSDEQKQKNKTAKLSNVQLEPKISDMSTKQVASQLRNEQMSSARQNTKNSQFSGQPKMWNKHSAKNPDAQGDHFKKEEIEIAKNGQWKIK